MGVGIITTEHRSSVINQEGACHVRGNHSYGPIHVCALLARSLLHRIPQYHRVPQITRKLETSAPVSTYYSSLYIRTDRLCGLMVTVRGYRSRGPGSIPGSTTPSWRSA
jgi:hypothetical protein